MFNVDAAVFKETNRMGLGILARDHNGDFIAACRQGVDNIVDPEMAEAVAFRRAINFAVQLPFKQVIIASDCLSLILKLRRVVKDRSHIAIIIQDIKESVRSSTDVVFSFTRVSRCCNVVAHVLAKSADQTNESIWHYVPPDFIWPALCNDRLMK